MCGIVGIREFRERVDAATLDAMRDTLSHRGPDDRGAWVSADGRVGLAHRRLAVLDPSPAGHQPMERDGVRIVHNGEVYNFRDVRSELESRGHRFTTQTDTEVILAGYREWGLDVVHRFRGMFATAILDERSGDLHLVRDRAGVKPLYYALSPQRLVFGSEMRALIRHPSVGRDVDADALGLYFKLSFVPSPWSIFRGVRKLDPGCILTVSADGRAREHRYWNVFDCFRAPPLGDIDETEAADELERRLREAFRLRTVSDVPVGVFLSGGVDSCTLAALLQHDSAERVRTFTVGFSEPAYDEAAAARRVARHLGTDHHEITVDPKTTLDAVPGLADMYDEPFGDSSGVPTHVVSRFAREHVKVALSADGGDELFLGYRHHQALRRAWPLFARGRRLAPLAGTQLARAFARRAGRGLDLKFRKLGQVATGGPPMTEFFFATRCYWTESEIARLVTMDRAHPRALLEPFAAFEPDAGGFVDYLRAADYRLLLPDEMLVKVDRASMATSLEAREPFLDHEIVEWVARLPERLIVGDGVTKVLLRRVLHRYVPPELVSGPKRGFAVPLDVWLRGELRPLLTDYINEERISRDPTLDWPTVRDDLDAFLSGRLSSSGRIWLVLEYQMWRERWLGA